MIHGQTGSTSINQSICTRQQGVRTFMHVRERNGRRTDTPWSRGHVFGEAQRPDPTDAAGSGAVAGAGVDALPGDVLVYVLRRLRAHSLARCRCVCALWRALVDDRGLLLPHALPRRTFPGFFANARVKPWRPGPGFLPPPASRAPGPDRFAFLRPHLPCRGGGEATVQDQCNGLVLCFTHDCLAGTPGAGFVCNPVTERWARLPPPPTWWPRGHEGLFLAFDPAVSMDYEVLLLPVPPPRQSNGDAGLRGEALRQQGRVTLGMFVPQSFGKQQAPSEEKLLPLLVFSSAGRQWTKRLLAPGRCAPAGLYDRVMRRRRRSAEGDPWVRTWRSAVYCRGSLYAHCEKRILVVLRCSEGTYDMVKLPADADAGAGQGDEDGEEAGGDGGADDGCSRRWWNWDDATLLDLDVGEDELLLDVGAGAPPPFTVLGCHPEREVIFLAAGAFHVVAYHLGSGKVQYLGRVMSMRDGDRLDGVFAYRPCIVDALPSRQLPVPNPEEHHQDSIFGPQLSKDAKVSFPSLPVILGRAASRFRFYHQVHR